MGRIARCPVCKEDIQEYDLAEGDNPYWCEKCHKELIVTKHSTVKYFVTTKDAVDGSFNKIKGPQEQEDSHILHIEK